MCGAVLNTLNTRLDAETIAFMLRHGGARVLITDREFSATIEQALTLLDERPLVIDIDDPSYQDGKTLGEIGYEAFLAEGDPDYAWQRPADEWDAISLNYTSGTTGDPKGVVYHHRGAYLNAISNVLDWDMPRTRCICGRCRCSIATAGAFRGRSPSAPAPACACGGSRRRRRWTRSATTT